MKNPEDKPREMKFRAWNKETKQFETVNTLNWMGETGHPDARLQGRSTDSGMAIFFLPEDFILMQYTGLKDKNGQEIYEGDIVKINNATAEVRWETEGYTSPVLAPFGHHIWSNNFEVIGNIHESPELINE